MKKTIVKLAMFLAIVSGSIMVASCEKSNSTEPVVEPDPDSVVIKLHNPLSNVIFSFDVLQENNVIYKQKIRMNCSITPITNINDSIGNNYCDSMTLTIYKKPNILNKSGFRLEVFGFLFNPDYSHPYEDPKYIPHAESYFRDSTNLISYKL